MVLSPKTTAQIVSAMSCFYFVSITFTNFAAKNYGEENASEQTVRAYQWIALSFGFTLVPFLLAVKAAGDSDAKLRRVLIFFMYWTCVNIGSMNHAGPQHAGGVFVDKEHKINTVMQLAMFFLAGMAISGGPPVYAEESYFKISSNVKLSLLVSDLAFFFWYLDIGTIGPGYAKYWPDFDPTDVYAYDGIRWFSAAVFSGSLWLKHAIAYGDGEAQKLLCQWSVLNNVINEVLIRYTSLGDKMPAAAMNEGTVLRLVLIGVAVWALLGVGKKKEA